MEDLHKGVRIMQNFKALRLILLILGFVLVTFGCSTGKNKSIVSDPRVVIVGTWNWALDYGNKNDYVEYVISVDAIQYRFFTNETLLSFTMSDITWIAEEDPYKTLYPDHPTNVAKDNTHKNPYSDYQAGYIIEGTITANSLINDRIWPEVIGEIRRIPIAMHKSDSQKALIASDFCIKQL